MRTEQIKYFLTAVESGSFTKAAELLDIQQPSLREAITNLEMELGEPLFVRSKRGISLNEYGKYCLPMLQSIYSSYEKMKGGMAPEKRIPMHMLADYSFDTYSANFYNNIQRKHPQRDVRLSSAPNLEYIINALMQDKIKIGFAIVPKLGDKKGIADLTNSLLEHTLEKSLISIMNLGVLMRSSHPLAQKKRVTVRDVLNYPIVASNLSFPVHQLLQYGGNSISAEPVIMHSWKLLESYLKTSDAVSFIPNTIDWNRNDFILKSLEKPAMVVEQYAIYKKDNNDEEIIDCINTMKMVVDSYQS